MKKLSEETGQKIKNISVRGHSHIQLATRNVYGRVFKLYGRFSVWEFETN